MLDHDVKAVGIVGQGLEEGLVVRRAADHLQPQVVPVLFSLDLQTLKNVHS